MAWNTRRRRLKWSSNDVGHHRLGERFTDQCVYDSDRIWGGSVVVWVGICHDSRTHLKIVQGILNAVKYRDNILDPIVLLSATAKRWSHGSCLSRLSHPCSSLVDIITGSIPQLNIYGMNSVDVFVTVKIHWRHYRCCVMHFYTSGTTSHKYLSNDWLVLCVGDAKLSLLQMVVTHVTEFCKHPYSMTSFVCPWFVLIMMFRNFVDITWFVMIIWI